MIQNRPLFVREQSRLENYFTKFAHKSIQAIVQSRTSTKHKSSSKQNSASYDWFNVALEDIKSIEQEADKIISTIKIISRFSLCVEVLLETSDRDRLILETWCIFFKEPCDPNVSTSSVYPALCVLLKSIICVSRITPAYKLSGRQSPDSYTVHYRLYYGEPQTHVLGEGYQENRIGEVRTPMGTLYVTLAYRTKMTISPQRIELSSPFMVKSDYFEPDMSPKKVHTPLLKNGFRNDAAKRHPSNDQVPNGVPDNVYNGGHDANSHNGVVNGHHPSENIIQDDYVISGYQNNCFDEDSKEEFKVKGAFAPSSTFPDPSLFPDLILPDKPLLSLSSVNLSSMQKMPDVQADRNANLSNGHMDNNKGNKMHMSDKVDYNCNESGDCVAKMSSSGNSEYGDFVMVDMKPPFAHSDSTNDVGAFYRECQSAPPLALFVDQPSLEEQVSDIGNKLALFEISMQDFDTFVDTFCHVDANEK